MEGTGVNGINYKCTYLVLCVLLLPCMLGEGGRPGIYSPRRTPVQGSEGEGVVANVLLVSH